MSKDPENEGAYGVLAMIFLFGVLCLLGGIAALPVVEWIRWFLASGVLLGIGIYCGRKIQE